LREDVQASGNNDLEVFFDHGREGESPNIVPYFEEYGTDTTLSHLDIAVVSKSERSILVCSELEEEGANPKLVIGDIANLFIAKQVRIGGDDYTLDRAKFLLGVRVAESQKIGEGRNKNDNSRRKVSHLGCLVPAIIKDASLKGITVKTVSESDYRIMVDKMERIICEWIGVPIAEHKGIYNG